MAAHVLTFEKPIVDLVARVRELRALADRDPKLLPELRRLEDKADRLARALFAELSPWQKVQLSRHPNRPYTLDYIGTLFEDFVELAGDLFAVTGDEGHGGALGEELRGGRDLKDLDVQLGREAEDVVGIGLSGGRRSDDGHARKRREQSARRRARSPRACR
jgi:acetyl-CoA carboxylase carboxyl transferase subunit alpha